MSSVNVFLLRCLAKSVVVMIPTSLLSCITGSLRILFLTILRAASLSGASGSITRRGVDIISEIFVFDKLTHNFPSFASGHYKPPCSLSIGIINSNGRP